MPTWVVVLVLGWILFDAGFAAGAWWASRPREDKPLPRDALRLVRAPRRFRRPFGAPGGDAA